MLLLGEVTREVLVKREGVGGRWKAEVHSTRVNRDRDSNCISI